MKGHEESLAQGNLFRTGIILTDEQRASIAEAYRGMVAKLTKYQEQLKGSNAFAIAMALDPK